MCAKACGGNGMPVAENWPWRNRKASLPHTISKAFCENGSESGSQHLDGLTCVYHGEILQRKANAGEKYVAGNICGKENIAICGNGGLFMRRRIRRESWHHQAESNRK